MWSELLHTLAVLALLNAAVWTQLRWGMRHCVSVVVSGLLMLVYVPGITGGAVCLGGALLVTLAARWPRRKRSPRTRAP